MYSLDRLILSSLLTIVYAWVSRCIEKLESLMTFYVSELREEYLHKLGQPDASWLV